MSTGNAHEPLSDQERLIRELTFTELRVGQLYAEIRRLVEDKRKLRIALTVYGERAVFDNYVAGADTQPWLFAQAALTACPPEPDAEARSATPGF